MKPVRAVRNAGRLGRKTKLKHWLEIGAVTANCESGARCRRPPPGVGHVRRGRQVDGASSWNNTLAWISTETNSPNLTPARLHILWAFSPCSVMLNGALITFLRGATWPPCLHVSRGFRVLLGEVALR